MLIAKAPLYVDLYLWIGLEIAYAMKNNYYYVIISRQGNNPMNSESLWR